MSIIEINGSDGEGGGQILRTALTLSMITGKPFVLKNIRAKRSKPGLMRQHLMCVTASQQLCNAQVRGAELGSKTLHFVPNEVQPGQYEFNIGSAGSTMLVLQTLLPALLVQQQASQVRIKGGTHNPMAPTADFIAKCFLPTLAKIGIQVDFELEQSGFYPVGGGSIHATIHPWLDRQPLSLLDRGDISSVKAFAGILNLAKDIAERELATLAALLKLDQSETIQLKGVGEGNMAFVHVQSAHHQQVIGALGERRKTADQVAHALAKEVSEYLTSGAVADEHLTDQLLMPLALGKGGHFTAQTISEHTRTQAALLKQFLPCEINWNEFDGQTRVEVQINS